MTLILYSLFYLALFIVACGVLTSCVKMIIHEWYASRAMLQHLQDDDEEREEIRKHINERMMEATRKK